MKVSFDDCINVNEIPNENNGRKVIRKTSKEFLKIYASLELIQKYSLIINNRLV